MGTIAKKCVSIATSTVLLLSTPVAFADGLNSKGKSRLPQGYEMSVRDAKESPIKVSLRSRGDVRAMQTRVWARGVIRGKHKQAKILAQAILRVRQPKAQRFAVSPPVSIDRERMVKADQAQSLLKCARLHTHERARCLKDTSRMRRAVPAVTAFLGMHSAAE